MIVYMKTDLRAPTAAVVAVLTACSGMVFPVAIARRIARQAPTIAATAARETAPVASVTETDSCRSQGE
jgi:hypothetical protein